MGFLGRRCLAVLIVVAGGLIAPMGPAAAQVSPTDALAAAIASADARVAQARQTLEPALAEFEGQRINLAAGWEQAKACLVLGQDQVECFRSGAALDTRVDTLKAQKAGGFSCASPLRLYEHSFFAGRQLMFYERGYWQNLSLFGFNDQMSSFSVGACWSWLAEHSTGGGAYYPGSGPYVSVGWLAPGWDNKVSSIYLA